MRLIDADTAQAGLTIVAREQTQGRGQRGRLWKDMQGESLLVSIVCTPQCAIERQFVFSAAVAVAVAETLTQLHEGWDVRIKWPNDIIINDKKAGGILIENVLRGNTWCFSIIGLGLNVRQTSFPADLPFATSLKLASAKDFDLKDVFERLRRHIFFRACSALSAQTVMNEFNDYLYRKDCLQTFTDGNKEWKGTVRSAASNGTLQVELADGSTTHYQHGSVLWKWE